MQTQFRSNAAGPPPAAANLARLDNNHNNSNCNSNSNNNNNNNNKCFDLARFGDIETSPAPQPLHTDRPYAGPRSQRGALPGKTQQGQANVAAGESFRTMI